MSKWAIESTKINKSVSGNKRIGLNKSVQVGFFSFSNKRPVRLFGTLEYSRLPNSL